MATLSGEATGGGGLKGGGEAGSGDGAAQRADRTVNPGLAGGVVGSIQARWRQLGGVTPLAVGAYGEVSASMCGLLAVATEYGTTKLALAPA